MSTKFKKRQRVYSHISKQYVEIESEIGSLRISDMDRRPGDPLPIAGWKVKLFNGIVIQPEDKLQAMHSRRFALASAWAKKHKTLVQLAGTAGTIISAAIAGYNLWARLF